jgi:hypothetical protein
MLLVLHVRCLLLLVAPGPDLRVEPSNAESSVGIEEVLRMCCPPPQVPEKESLDCTRGVQGGRHILDFSQGKRREVSPTRPSISQ